MSGPYKRSPLDSEFNSASNDDTFIHGTSIGKMFYPHLYSSSVGIFIGEKNPSKIFPMLVP